MVRYNTLTVFNQYCLPNSDEPQPDTDFEMQAVVADLAISDIQEIWLDIVAAKIAYIQIPFTLILVAALYISLMHYRTKYFLWTSVFISFSFILAMAIFIQDYRSKYFPGCDSEDDSTPECTQPATIGNLL